MDYELFKELFGDGQLTFEAFKAALEGADKSKIKLANLADGGYVDKAKFEGNSAELKKANELIKQLKGSQPTEDQTAKIQSYESDIKGLQEQIKKERAAAEIKVALLEAGATDTDYLTFKLGQDIDVDDEGKVKNLTNLIKDQKTSYPSFFKSEDKSDSKVIVKKLPGKDKSDDTGLTKEQFEKLGYQERVKLFNENPDAYKEFSGKGE